MECRACPLECRADRAAGRGACGANDRFEVSNIQLHLWEEPPISGMRGSGTVFFSHCNLHCRFCQNWEISQLGRGRAITDAELESAILGLVEQGAHNVNLVSPTQYTDQLVPLLERLVPRLAVPVVWNSNAYEKLDRIQRLEGLVRVWLPDIKYQDDALARRYSSAPGYFGFASAAVSEMVRQVGANDCDDEGILRSGIIVRHLVLPGHSDDSIRILDWIAQELGTGVAISLMAQYYPAHRAAELEGMNRRLRPSEYARVRDHLEELGFETAFVQQLSSASSDYTPDFT
ncbi:radical SAM protein [candidate division WOR-3 bacterium]|nr:radical SAM protein [candidate division WOR-3 bacterium]